MHISDGIKHTHIYAEVTFQQNNEINVFVLLLVISVSWTNNSINFDITIGVCKELVKQTYIIIIKDGYIKNPIKPFNSLRSSDAITYGKLRHCYVKS